MVQGHSLPLPAIVLSCLCLSTVPVSFPSFCLHFPGLSISSVLLPSPPLARPSGPLSLLTLPLSFPSFLSLLLLLSLHLFSPSFLFSVLIDAPTDVRDPRSALSNMATTNPCGCSNSNELKLNGIKKPIPPSITLVTFQGLSGTSGYSIGPRSVWSLPSW